MRRLLLLPLVVSCGGTPAPRGRAATPEGASPCIVVREEPAGIETDVDGTLESAGNGFVLRLDRARCVVGLTGANVLVEVGLVSTGFDLRPLVGHAVRAVGEASPSTNALGGPSVVVIASSVERRAIGTPDGTTDPK